MVLLRLNHPSPWSPFPPLAEVIFTASVQPPRPTVRPPYLHLHPASVQPPRPTVRRHTYTYTYTQHQCSHPGPPSAAIPTPASRISAATPAHRPPYLHLHPASVQPPRPVRRHTSTYTQHQCSHPGTPLATIPTPTPSISAATPAHRPPYLHLHPAGASTARRFPGASRVWTDAWDPPST